MRGSGINNSGAEYGELFSKW